MDLALISADLGTWAMSMGYIGVFIINFIGSSTIIFPLPAFITVTAIAAMEGINPWGVGISAGAGAALGETVGYVLGKGSGKIIDRKYKNHMKKYRQWFKKDNVFFGIILFAATPLPDDVVGVLCGMFHYDFKKFLVASFIGKTILNLGLAFIGFYGSSIILEIFSNIGLSGIILGVFAIIATTSILFFASHRK